ncbi:MAG: FadR/GntR family transcriptional regulator [Kiloniellales bacterium]
MNNVVEREIAPPWNATDLASRPITGTVKSLATELFARVCADRYSFGTRLPSERQLADEFGVSRNAVRQSLELLENFDVVSRRPGSGTFVSYRPAANETRDTGSVTVEGLLGLDEIAEMTSPLELNVVRTIVEPEIVRLAVINMSARDIRRLKDILVKLESIATDAAAFSHWDELFYLELAKGTHNPLLIAMYTLINHVRRQAHWAPTKEKTLSPNRIRDYQKLQRSIVEAIEARDLESAVEFVKLHMSGVQDDLIRGA